MTERAFLEFRIWVTTTIKRDYHLFNAHECVNFRSDNIMLRIISTAQVVIKLA